MTSSFDRDYPNMSKMPTWKRGDMLAKLAAVAKGNQMGFSAEDFADMEAREIRDRNFAALHAPALEAARLKAMGHEEPAGQGLLAALGIWRPQVPAAA